MATRKITIVVEVKGAGKAATTIKKTGDATKKAGASAKKASKGFDSMALSVAKGMLVSRGLTVALGSLSNAMKFGAKQALDYQLSVAKIQAITGTTGTSLKSLTSEIREIAAISPKTAAEVANTALAMAKLGLSSDETRDALEGVVGLSVALDEDVEAVGQTLVSVKNVFQKEASELTKISNQLFTGFAKSALNLDKFSTAFSFAGGTAKLAGVNISEMTAAMGVLASSGIRASTVGTQLRKIFLELSISGSKAGKAIGGETIQSIGLEEALRRLAPIVKDAGKAKELFGLRAVSVIKILTSSIDKYKELNTEIEGTGDKLSAASDLIKNTVIGRVKTLTSAWTELGISIGETRTGPINKVLDALTKFVRIGGLSEKANQITGGRGFAFTAKRKENERVLKELIEADRVRRLFSKGTTKDLTPKTEENLKTSQFYLNLQEDIAKQALARLNAEKKVLDTETKSAAATKKRSEALKILNKEYSNFVDTLALLEAEGKKIEKNKAIQGFLGFGEKFKDKGEKGRAASAINEANKIIADSEKAIFEASKAAIEKKLDLNKSEIEAQKELIKVKKEALKLAIKENEQALFLETTTTEFTLAAIAITESAKAVDTLTASFVSMIGKRGGLEDFGKTFNRVLRGIVSNLVASIIKMAIFKIVLNTIAPGAGIGATGFSGAGLSTLQALTLTAFGGKAQPQASGFNGVVNKPTAFVAGEAGAERVRVTT